MSCVSWIKDGWLQKGSWLVQPNSTKKCQIIPFLQEYYKSCNAPKKNQLYRCKYGIQPKKAYFWVKLMQACLEHFPYLVEL